MPRKPVTKLVKAAARQWAKSVLRIAHYPAAPNFESVTNGCALRHRRPLRKHGRAEVTKTSDCSHRFSPLHELLQCNEICSGGLFRMRVASRAPLLRFAGGSHER